MQIKSIGELVRKQENDYINGTTTISKYVSYSMYDVIETISAYLNSKHTSGQFDSLNREKPFFNIVTAVANIWYRATDIDTSNIKVRATKSKDWIDSFLATIYLQDWMKKNRFGVFLNEWGRVLSRYGSAVVKTVKNKDGLSISVIPWDSLIVDTVDFDNNPKIEVLQLTEAQLRLNKSYDQEAVTAMINAKQTRETLDKKNKDTKNDYYMIYEVHGLLPLSMLNGREEDENTFVQQMHVVSFVGGKKKGKDDYEDFTLYSGRESKDPYRITHLIKEDNRTLSIGAVEHLFEAQWMVNHSTKAIKDQLDLASKLFFQTSDVNFVGQNALSAIETGDILIHSINQPLTQANNASHDITSLQNFAVQWKSLGNEITGISEAMLGAAPKSGTAWRQTEALLQESYNLFELMTENKGLYIVDMMREDIIPYIKTKIDTSEEVSAVLKNYDIDRIDGIYIKNMSVKMVNDKIKEMMLSGEMVTQEGQTLMLAESEKDIKQALNQLGNQRFFSPDEIGDKTWKEQFKDLEWDLEIDVTGEQKNTQEALATLNTALQVMLNPAYEQSPKAQRVVNRILEMTGTISPLEMEAIPSPQIQPLVEQRGGSTPNVEGLLQDKQPNIQNA